MASGRPRGPGDKLTVQLHLQSERSGITFKSIVLKTDLMSLKTPRSPVNSIELRFAFDIKDKEVRNRHQIKKTSEASFAKLNTEIFASKTVTTLSTQTCQSPLSILSFLCHCSFISGTSIKVISSLQTVNFV